MGCLTPFLLAALQRNSDSNTFVADEAMSVQRHRKNSAGRKRNINYNGSVKQRVIIIMCTAVCTLRRDASINQNQIIIYRSKDGKK